MLNVLAQDFRPSAPPVPEPAAIDGAAAGGENRRRRRGRGQNPQNPPIPQGLRENQGSQDSHGASEGQGGGNRQGNGHVKGRRRKEKSATAHSAGQGEGILPSPGQAAAAAAAAEPVEGAVAGAGVAQGSRAEQKGGRKRQQSHGQQGKGKGSKEGTQPRSQDSAAAENCSELGTDDQSGTEARAQNKGEKVGLGKKGRGGKALDSQSSKVSASSKRSKWWKTLAEDDPISLEPLASLPYQPFNLKASDTVDVWFDPKVLANYLVSTGNLVHPVNRRALTREDCEGLDKHLQTCQIKKVGVVEVFEHQERMKDPSERILYLQDQATMIMQAIFAGVTTNARLSRPSSRPAPRNNRQRNEAADEANTFMVDDDEAYSYFGDDMPRGHGTAGSRGGTGTDNWFQPPSQEEAWPELLSTGLPVSTAWQSASEAALPAPSAQTHSQLSDGKGAVFHVSQFATPSKTETRHLYNLFSPHQAVVKWLDKYSALVYTPEASAVAAAAAVKLNDKRDFHVVTLQELEKTITHVGRNAVLTDFRGKKGRSISLPSLGELRFLIEHLKTKKDLEVVSTAWQDDDDLDEETRYQNWLKARWQKRAQDQAEQAEGSSESPQGARSEGAEAGSEDSGAKTAASEPAGIDPQFAEAQASGAAEVDMPTAIET